MCVCVCVLLLTSWAASSASHNVWPKKIPSDAMSLSMLVNDRILGSLSHNGIHTDTQKAYHLTSSTLAVVVPAAIVLSPSIASLPTDIMLSLTLPLHSWWGMRNVINDYVPPALRASANTLMLILVIVMFLGLMNLTLRGPGVIDSVKQLWREPGDTIALKNIPGMPGAHPLK